MGKGNAKVSYPNAQIIHFAHLGTVGGNALLGIRKAHNGIKNGIFDMAMLIRDYKSMLGISISFLALKTLIVALEKQDPRA